MRNILTFIFKNLLLIIFLFTTVLFTLRAVWGISNDPLWVTAFSLFIFYLIKGDAIAREIHYGEDEPKQERIKTKSTQYRILKRYGHFFVQMPVKVLGITLYWKPMEAYRGKMRNQDEIEFVYYSKQWRFGALLIAKIAADHAVLHHKYRGIKIHPLIEKNEDGQIALGYFLATNKPNGTNNNIHDVPCVHYTLERCKEAIDFHLKVRNTKYEIVYPESESKNESSEPVDWGPGFKTW